MFVVRTL